MIRGFCNWEGNKTRCFFSAFSPWSEFVALTYIKNKIAETTTVHISEIYNLNTITKI